MTAIACARKWQVEAARDGRLLGKDLERAIRHQENCAECAAEARELAQLGRGLGRLPEVTRDELTTQRARQQLFATLNDSLLDPPRRSLQRPLAAALGLGLLAAAAWLVAVKPRPMPASAPPLAPDVVSVHAEPGARWSKHQDASLVRVELADGAASFNVFPHPGRRVVVSVPDGQIEDLGTVFEVRVSDGRTAHVAVSEGRVSVQLNGRAALSLGSGDTWDAEPSAPPIASAVAESNPPALPAASLRPASPALRATPHQPPDKPAVPAASPAPAAASAGSAKQPSADSAAPPSAEPSERAEDDAYLHIVDLLRAGQDAAAHREAKAYLLRFPGGFRRIEVLNIATRGARDAGHDDTKAR